MHRDHVICALHAERGAQRGWPPTSSAAAAAASVARCAPKKWRLMPCSIPRQAGWDAGALRDVAGGRVATASVLMDTPPHSRGMRCRHRRQK